MNMGKPKIRVDFNELVKKDLLLLSDLDKVQDSEGNEIELAEGLAISVYEFNHYDNGEKEYILAEGIAERNDPEKNGRWSMNAKWCCRINGNGIQVETVH